MIEKLEPCPFCGADAMITFNTSFGYQVYCSNDGCFMSECIMSGFDNEEAVAAWNRRAATEANEALTLDSVAKEYLEICGEDCAGDPSVGLPGCPFYSFPDVDASGEPLSGGCQLAAYRRPPEWGEG